MGCYLSKERPATNTSAATKLPYKSELCSYKVASETNADLQSFATCAEARICHAVTRLAMGVEAGSVSFGSLTGVTEGVVDVTLQCKKDTLGNPELFELVEKYFENSSRTLEFCAALEKCVKRANDTHLLVLAAVNQFEKERENGCDTYLNTFKELKCFRAAGRPFTVEFILMLQSVYQQQMSMLQRLQLLKNKVDKKIKCINALRKASNVTFVAVFTAVFISSAVAATAAAPPVAAALSASCSVPIGYVGKWVNTLWKNYEKSSKRQMVIINSMQVGTYVAINDLDNIRVLIERLEIDIASMLNNAELASEEGAIYFRVADIRKRLGGIVKIIESLGYELVFAAELYEEQVL